MNETNENLQQSSVTPEPTAEPQFERSSMGQYSAPNQQQPLFSEVTPSAQQSLDSVGFFRKKSIRRLGTGVGLPLSLFFILQEVLALVVIQIMKAFLGDVATASWFLNPDNNYILSAFMTTLVLTLPYLITAHFSGIKLNESVRFAKVPLSKAVSVVMLGMGVCALSNIANSYFASALIKLFGIVPETTMIEYGTGLQSFIIMLVCVGILPAIIEEFAFRGVILGTLRKYFGDTSAVLISAALFSLLHGNLQQIPFAFCVGLVLGYAVVYTNSIVPAMVIHALNNSFSVVLSYTADSLSPLMNGMITLLYLAVLMLIGVCGFVMLTTADTAAFKLGGKPQNSHSKDLGWFCSSPWMVVFFVLVALQVIAVQLAPILEKT